LVSDETTTHAGARTRLGRPFAVLWTASAVSNLGDGVRLAALPLMTAAVSRDPFAVAAVSFAGQLPWLLTSLVAGAIADRLDRRTVMWTVDLFRALLVLGLAIIIGAGAFGVGVLCAVAFLIGVGQTLFDNAGQALLPTLVLRTALPSANGRLLTAQSVTTSFLGPPLGGVLFAAAAVLPFLVDMVSFALAAILVGFLLRPHSVSVTDTTTRPGKSSLRGDIGEGLRWLARHAVLRSVGVLIAVVNFTQAATQSVLVLFALQELNIGQRGFGALLAVTGLGGLTGGLCGTTLRRWIRPARLFATTILVTAPIFVILGATSSPLVAGLMLGLNSFAGVTASVLLQTLRQSIVPDLLMARVSSVMGLLSIGIGLPLGSAAGGVLAQLLGLRAPFLISGLLIALTSIAVPRISRAFTRIASVGETTSEPDEKCW
jgi:predicted MFS family arabinose efflux permease